MSFFTRRIVMTLSLALALAFPTAVATAAGPGPKVGAPIPHQLEAVDQNGKQRNFKTLTGTRGLLLIFSRSLDW